MENDINQSDNEFKIFGMNIENLSIFYGLFLIIWGIIISLISGSNSFTSYIPSILGLPIFIFSYLSIKFVSKKKMFMHIVVLIGLIIFSSGLCLFGEAVIYKYEKKEWFFIGTSSLILINMGIGLMIKNKWGSF